MTKYSAGWLPPLADLPEQVAIDSGLPVKKAASFWKFGIFGGEDTVEAKPPPQSKTRELSIWTYADGQTEKQKQISWHPTRKLRHAGLSSYYTLEKTPRDSTIATPTPDEIWKLRKGIKQTKGTFKDANVFSFMQYRKEEKVTVRNYDGAILMVDPVDGEKLIYKTAHIEDTPYEAPGVWSELGDNLFYVFLEGETLPSYHFWQHKGDVTKLPLLQANRKALAPTSSNKGYDSKIDELQTKLDNFRWADHSLKAVHQLKALFWDLSILADKNGLDLPEKLVTVKFDVPTRLIKGGKDLKHELDGDFAADWDKERFVFHLFTILYIFGLRAVLTWLEHSRVKHESWKVLTQQLDSKSISLRTDAAFSHSHMEIVKRIIVVLEGREPKPIPARTPWYWSTKLSVQGEPLVLLPPRLRVNEVMDWWEGRTSNVTRKAGIGKEVDLPTGKHRHQPYGETEQRPSKLQVASLDEMESLRRQVARLEDELAHPQCRVCGKDLPGNTTKARSDHYQIHKSERDFAHDIFKKAARGKRGELKGKYYIGAQYYHIEPCGPPEVKSRHADPIVDNKKRKSIGDNTKSGEEYPSKRPKVGGHADVEPSKDYTYKGGEIIIRDNEPGDNLQPLDPEIGFESDFESDFDDPPFVDAPPSRTPIADDPAPMEHDQTNNGNAESDKGKGRKPARKHSIKDATYKPQKGDNDTSTEDELTVDPKPKLADKAPHEQPSRNARKYAPKDSTYRPGNDEDVSMDEEPILKKPKVAGKDHTDKAFKPAKDDEDGGKSMMPTPPVTPKKPRGRPVRKSQRKK